MLRFHEGEHEIRNRHDGQNGGEELEDDHSFSTAFPSSPTATNRAITPST